MSEIGNVETYSKMMDEILRVYNDLEKIAVGKEVYVYLDYHPYPCSSQ